MHFHVNVKLKASIFILASSQNTKTDVAIVHAQIKLNEQKLIMQSRKKNQTQH